jgi:hypothetical protein
MVYIFVKMHMALHAFLETLVMAYVSFEMRLTPITINILIIMHLAHRISLMFF